MRPKLLYDQLLIHSIRTTERTITDTVLSNADTVQNNTDKYPCPYRAYIQGRRGRKNNKVNYATWNISATRQEMQQNKEDAKSYGRNGELKTLNSLVLPNVSVFPFPGSC